MRLVAAFFLTSTVGLWSALAQSEVATESNANCVERLRMPAYPKLADQARIQGSVIANVTIAPDGSIQKTAVDIMDITSLALWRKGIFAPAVEDALRASTFRKSCSGKSVTLVFNFVIDQKLDPNGLPQSVSYEYPNRFIISIPPKIIQP